MMNEYQKLAFYQFTMGHNVCITGPAGSGKSYTLRNITEWAQKHDKTIAVTASTGTAAILINGRTVHSYLGIGLAKKNAEDLAADITRRKPNIRKTLLSLDALVIDEISMLNAELLDKISDVLGIVRRKPHIPFGGVQMILIGDFTQLPPTNGEYCFRANVWSHANIDVIELKKIERQKDDLDFQDILNEVRWGKCSRDTYDKLKELKKTKFSHGVIPTILFPTNINVDEVNEYKFRALVEKHNNVLTTDDISKSKIRTYIYKTEYSNEHAKAWAQSSKIIDMLTLCPGAQVVCTWNVSQDEGIINGTRAVVKSCHQRHVVITLSNGREYKMEYLTVKDEDYNNISFSFIPLKLAWALTIHKSQGMTLDAVVIDLGTGIFEYGQAYTALSRVKDMKSVRLLALSRKSFKTHPDVLDFYQKFI